MSALQPSSQNLPVGMMHGGPPMVSEMNESKQKNEDKVRMVRGQQGGGSGRQRSSTDRDLMGKS
jgi:hypothetical protein